MDWEMYFFEFGKKAHSNGWSGSNGCVYQLGICTDGRRP